MDTGTRQGRVLGDTRSSAQLLGGAAAGAGDFIGTLTGAIQNRYWPVACLDLARFGEYIGGPEAKIK